jgi:hypothetical protein
MSHRTLAGLIVALVASSGQSPSDLSTAAQPAAVAVSLLSVSPATPSGDDWCVDAAAEVTLTAHVVDLASQSEVAEGTIEWQTCTSPTLEGLPKEDCDGHGPARWAGAVISDLSVDSTPSLHTRFVVPVLGFRLQFRPAPGSGFKRATSASFNLDRTCSLLPTIQ